MSRKVAKLPEGYEHLLLRVGQYDVAIRAKAKLEIDANASVEQRAGLEDLLVRYAESGPAGLPRTKLNGNEGWFPSEKAAGKVRLQAFKPWQLRAYGFCRDFDGRPTFFITGVDCSKKQDKANQKILNAAGSEAFSLNQKLK